MRKKIRSNIVLLFLLPNLFFFALAYLIPTNLLIALMNVAALSIAGGVVVAYCESVFVTIFREGRVDEGDYLSLGIFLGWLAIVASRTWVILWRLKGQPDDMQNTWLIAYFVFMAGCAGLFHLFAPWAIRNERPTSRAVKIGTCVAAVSFVVMAVVYSLGNLPL